MIFGTLNNLSTSVIIDTFYTLIQKANTDKTKGFQFKTKSYQNTIDAFKKSNTQTINTLEQAYTILKQSGMKLNNEPYTPTDGFTKQPKSKILAKILILLQNGVLEEAQKAQIDPLVVATKQLTQVHAIGPAKAKTLFQDHNISTIQQLRDAIIDNPTIINSKQQIGLKYCEHLSQRIPRDEMDQWNTLLGSILEQLGVQSQNYTLVGSYRRNSQSCGDIDLYVSVHPNVLDKWITLIIDKLIDKNIILKDNILSKGNKKMMAVAKINQIYRHLDIFVHPFQTYPFAILHATGSKKFNVLIRQHALSNGWSLSEHGFKDVKTKNPPTSEIIKSKLDKPQFLNENDIFTFLDLQYIPPQHREHPKLIPLH